MSGPLRWLEANLLFQPGDFADQPFSLRIGQVRLPQTVAQGQQDHLFPVLVAGIKGLRGIFFRSHAIRVTGAFVFTG